MEFRADNGRLQPGIGFHPTDDMLVMHYLKRKVMGRRLEPQLITEVDIYKFHPEDLRALSQYELFKDPTWYFFCARERKYSHGDRTNRAAPSGYWKPTGPDKPVYYRGQTVGSKKTLVFHQGKSPKGERTDWVMHEYRLEDRSLVVEDEYVICKVFKKSGIGPKNREQHGAEYIEEEWDDEQDKSNSVPTFSVVDQAPTPMSNATDVSRDPVLSNGEEYLDALVFNSDEFGAIYGGLENIMELNDLLEPLLPHP